MLEEEVKHMKETAVKGFKNSTDPIWRKAFLNYNNAMKEKAQPALGMQCTPCYFKVLKHFQDAAN